MWRRPFSVFESGREGLQAIFIAKPEERVSYLFFAEDDGVFVVLR
jgi:hypothetical protein